MTLTQTAILTKRLALGLIILITLGISSKIGFDIWQKYKLQTTPPTEEIAESSFGSLPKIQFPAAKVSTTNYSYSLDTATGGLPEYPKLIKVYFIPPGTISFLSPEKARKLAEGFGFTNGPEMVSENIEHFSDDNLGSININVLNGNFKFQKKLVTKPGPVENFPQSAQLIQEFKNYLSAKGLLKKEFEGGRGAVVLENLESGASASAAVSLWPKEINQIKIITINPNQSILTGHYYPHHIGAEKFLKVDYTFWTVDESSSSTYPLKSANEAFEDLKKGDGFISLEPSKPQVSITSSYLAYLITEEYTPFLQPVHVFEGPNFVALVGAIKY